MQRERAKLLALGWATGGLPVGPEPAQAATFSVVHVVDPALALYRTARGRGLLLGIRGGWRVDNRLLLDLLEAFETPALPDDVVARLVAEYPPEQLYFGILELVRRGWLSTDTPPATPTARWWRAHGAEPPLRPAPVQLLPVRADEAALSALTAALRSAGVEPAQSGVVVVVTDAYQRPELDTVAESLFAADRPWLPVRLAAAETVAGPLFVGRSDAETWRILRQRTDALHRDALDAGEVCGDLPAPPPAQPPHPAGVTAIAAAVARATRAGQAGFLRDTLLSFDTWTLETRRHRITRLPHPTPPGDGRLELRPCPKRHTSDGGHRAYSPEETWERLAGLVSPLCGLVPAIVRVRQARGIHVFRVAASTDDSEAAGDERRLGRTIAAGGKGMTETQARVSCLAEAIERHAGRWRPGLPTRRAPLDALAGAVDPRRLLLFSDAQYAAPPDALEPRRDKRVPARFDPAARLDWTQGWSLTERTTRWLPTAYCYTGYPFAPDEAAFALANSNGCAAGNTLEEAILQGTLELIERDACAIWWYNRLRRPALDPSSFDLPYFRTLRQHLSERGRVLYLLDLTHDLGIPVFCAVSWRQADGGEPVLGLGAHLDPDIAAARALTELNQPLVSLERAEPKSAHPDRPESHRRHWLDTATVAAHPFWQPQEGATRSRRDYRDLAGDDVRDDVMLCVDRLRAAGLELIVLDQTHPDVGFPVVRVVVPGLGHFWPRLAPGRLYDVPVRAGWLEVSLEEAQLNPTPFPF